MRMGNTPNMRHPRLADSSGRVYVDGENFNPLYNLTCVIDDRPFPATVVSTELLYCDASSFITDTTVKPRVDFYLKADNDVHSHNTWWLQPGYNDEYVDQSCGSYHQCEASTCTATPRRESAPHARRLRRPPTANSTRPARGMAVRARSTTGTWPRLPMASTGSSTPTTGTRRARPPCRRRAGATESALARRAAAPARDAAARTETGTTLSFISTLQPPTPAARRSRGRARRSSSRFPPTGGSPQRSTRSRHRPVTRARLPATRASRADRDDNPAPAPAGLEHGVIKPQVLLDNFLVSTKPAQVYVGQLSVAHGPVTGGTVVPCLAHRSGGSA